MKGKDNIIKGDDPDVTNTIADKIGETARQKKSGEFIIRLNDQGHITFFDFTRKIRTLQELKALII